MDRQEETGGDKLYAHKWSSSCPLAIFQNEELPTSGPQQTARRVFAVLEPRPYTIPKLSTSTSRHLESRLNNPSSIPTI